MQQIHTTNNRSKDIFIFIIGLFSMIKLRLLGTFGASELLVFVSYIYINPLFALRNKQVRQFITFAFIWLIGVIISDLVNQTGVIDSLKGAFNVIFLILLIPFCYWALYDKPERMLWFWAGVAISSIIGFKFQRVENMNDLSADIWQVYAVKWLFLFLGGWLYYKGRKKLAYTVIITFALWTLWHLSRNIFLTFTLATTILIYIGDVDESNKVYKYLRYRRNILKLFLIIAIALFGIKFTYETLATNGTLGERAKEKYELQSNSEMGLASGRADFLAALYAISKKPVFGYGSYAKDKNHIIGEFNSLMGLPDSPIRKGGNFVPGHSYMLGAWVYAGFLGFIFWVFILKKIFLFMRDHLFDITRLLCLILLLTISFLWDIFFSPFSDRLNFAMYILTIIIISSNNRQLDVKQIR